MAVRATGTNRRSSVMVPPLFGHDAVENLAVSNHPELLPRHPLLHRRVRLEVARQLGQRIDLDAQRGDFGALVRELPPDGDPVRGAVLAAPDRQGEQTHAAGDPGNPCPRHKPYRWRPGQCATSRSSSSIRSSWLYFATRSPLQALPVLIWPRPGENARSGGSGATGSPERRELRLP